MAAGRPGTSPAELGGAVHRQRSLLLQLQGIQHYFIVSIGNKGPHRGPLDAQSEAGIKKA